MEILISQQNAIKKITELFLERQCDRARVRQSILEIDKLDTV